MMKRNRNKVAEENLGVVSINSIYTDVMEGRAWILISPTGGYPLDETEDLGENGIYDYDFLMIIPKSIRMVYGTVRCRYHDIPVLYELSVKSCENFIRAQKYNLPDNVKAILWGKRKEETDDQ